MMLDRRALLAAAAASGALAAASPALAQNARRYIPPLEGLLPAGHVIEDAPRPFDREAMRSGKLALIPSQNYVEYTDWWERRVRDYRPNAVARAMGATATSHHGFRDVSETFLCEKGSITTSRQGYTLYNGKQPVRVATRYDITEDAVNEFIAGARTGQVENSAPWAVESTLTAIMAREAIYSGKERTWKDVG